MNLDQIKCIWSLLALHIYILVKITILEIQLPVVISRMSVVPIRTIYYLIGYCEEVLMQIVAAWRHVLEVSSFVEEQEKSSSIHSLYALLRDTIELHDKFLENGCVCIEHLCGGVRVG